VKSRLRIRYTRVDTGKKILNQDIPNWTGRNTGLYGMGLFNINRIWPVSLAALCGREEDGFHLIYVQMPTPY
jgi:hypothetical protein